MKKTITLLAILIATLTITIEATASQLYLRTYAYNTKASISGMHFYDRHGEIFAGNLRPGNHYLSVRSVRGYSSWNNQNWNHRNRSHRLLFRGRIFIPQNSIVYARISRNGRLIIDDVLPMRRPKYNRHPHRGKGYKNGNGHRKHDRRYEDRDRYDDYRRDRHRNDEDWRDDDWRDDDDRDGNRNREGRPGQGR